MDRKHRKRERGQVLVLCAICLIVLLLFVGLAIDFGLAYVTKASLGKAVDAAVLIAAKNTGAPGGPAPIAKSAFFMNYGTSSRDTSTPVVTVCNNVPCPTNALGDTLITVTATSTIQTYFIGLLPSFRTLNVSASAQAQYARVEMTIVIDRTGSMASNAPGTSLGDAITSFVGYFDDTYDSVAMISFANDQTIDFPMTTGNFKASIGTAAANYRNRFRGATFSDGALQLAHTVDSTVLPIVGNVVHVVVFFTDGDANTVEGPLTCTGSGNVKSGTWTFGGFDDGSTVGFMTSDQSYYQTASNCPDNNSRYSDVFYPLNNNPYDACNTQAGGSGACNGLFTTLAGTQQTLTWTHVNADALNRAVADANAMRAATPPTIVYAVGLNGTSGVLHPLFLCQIANDPSAYCAGLGYTATTPQLTQGIFALASDSSQLQAAFQQIASDIRLRLLQ